MGEGREREERGVGEGRVRGSGKVVSRPSALAYAGNLDARTRAHAVLGVDGGGARGVPRLAHEGRHAEPLLGRVSESLEQQRAQLRYLRNGRT